jgi:hypothetical protein
MDQAALGERNYRTNMEAKQRKYLIDDGYIVVFLVYPATSP